MNDTKYDIWHDEYMNADPKRYKALDELASVSMRNVHDYLRPLFNRLQMEVTS